ncbi:MAG: S-layer homology domain-containing protein [Candidatus Peregrinibacteria bacterium]
MKKFVILIGVFAVMGGIASAGSFPDVAEDHEHYDAIEYLDEHEIIQGYEDGTFKPDDLVNRAEAVKIVVGGLGVEHGGDYDVLFPDVKKSDWFFEFVMGGREFGLIGGYEDGTFKPGNNVNLAEMLKIIVQASGVELSEVDENVFLDVDKDVWYAPHALFARDHNVVLPDNYGKLHAENFMTRGEVAEVIYRMMIVEENGGKPFALHTDWPKYEGVLLAFNMKYDDKTWNVSVHEDEVVFWRPDSEFLQFTHSKMYPNSAVVTVTLDENEGNLSESHYFSNVKAAFLDATYTEFEWEGFSGLEVLYPEDRIVDWYIYLDDGDVLVIYTEFGPGPMGYLHRQYIGAMLSTLKYKEVQFGADYSGLLDEIFSVVLVEGMGMEKLSLVPDKVIIETDTIGVGTGPVDYYYSALLEWTFKYERGSDVILDTREGETTAF